MRWQGDLDDELTCSRLNFSLLPPKHILFKEQMHDQDTLDMAKFYILNMQNSVNLRTCPQDVRHWKRRKPKACWHRGDGNRNNL